MLLCAKIVGMNLVGTLFREILLRFTSLRGKLEWNELSDHLVIDNLIGMILAVL